MYDIGDEIYCINSVADCTQGTIYAVTGFGFSIVSKNKVYASKKQWNTANQNVSIDRELVMQVKSRIGDMTLKAYIESLIRLDLRKHG